MKKILPPSRLKSKRINRAVFFMLAALLCFAQPKAGRAASVVADLDRFPQKAAAYMPAKPDEPIASYDEQAVYAGEYLRSHFAPWTHEDLSYLDISFDRVLSYHASFGKKQYFTTDGKTFPRASMNALLANAAIDAEALVPRAGVALRDADVRVLPLSEPLYTNAASAVGERGLLKLDALQNSTIKPGEPLAIYAMSQDSAWCFIATGTVVGWVRSSAVALAAPEFVERYMLAEMSVAIKDNIRVKDSKGQLRCTVKMGAVLPREGANVLLPVRGKQGLAEISPFKPEAGAFAPFPVPFTPRNAIRAIDQLMGEPYGWGGLNGFRDCSAMTRDYFSLFGVWLPRNSGDQARVGAYLPLKNTQVSLRASTVADGAVPFATLLHMPGHIMLYIGVYNSEPVVFHNMWGVRVNAVGGKTGRHVVGKTVATSLKPGLELKNRQKNAMLVDNLAAMAFPMASVSRK